MTARPSSLKLLRRLGPFILTAPLFQGACIDLWQSALVNGFFRGATPVFEQALQDALDAQRQALIDIAAAAANP